MSQTDSNHTAAVLLEELESIRVLLDAAAMPASPAAEPPSANCPVPLPDDAGKPTTEGLPDTDSIQEVHQVDGSAEDISALRDAVKMRIDQTISNWLDDIVAHNMIDLRSRLAGLADEELERTIKLLSERNDAEIDPPCDEANRMDPADG